MPILIDGYNLLYAFCGITDQMPMKDPEGAREELLGLLGHYHRRQRQKITVYFDGRRHRGTSPEQSPRGVGVIYVGPESDADTAIIEAVQKSSHPRSLRIVSSDREVARAARRRRAHTVGSGVFAKELLAALKRSERRPQPEPRMKFEGPSKADVDYWLKIFEEADS